jgi:hypothetical protein
VKWAAAALLLALLCDPASSQEVRDWSEVEAVVVQAKPGPAVWHLTRGDSEVWILGLAGPLPEDLDWNQDYVAELLTGARAILMPPQADVGLVDAAWFLLWHGSELSLPRGQTLEPSLPEPLRSRFTAARTAVGGDPDDYNTDIPIRAAFRLQQNLVKKEKLRYGEPRRTIEKFANRARIPNAPVLQVSAMDSIRDVLKLDAAQQRGCLTEAVEDVQWALVHARPAAQAWAVGDIRGVKANYTQSRLFDCMTAAVGRIADLSARGASDYAAAIDRALDKPGKTIAVMNIAQLLRKGGVLERLKAQRAAIEGPAD